MTEPTIITMGCRLNAFESDRIASLVKEAGLADCVVVNTCGVTATAVREAAQTVRRLARERPDARVIVTGCAAQLEPQRFAAMPEVAAVIGNREKLELQTFEALARAPACRVAVGDIMKPAAADHGQRSARELVSNLAIQNRARAHLAVQTGCDHRCTFCIIPFARGPSRSVPISEAVEGVRTLVGRGYGEVVLTGVDLTAYGADFEDGTTLSVLVQQILIRVPELKRLRLSSIDQVEADEALIETFASEERLMPHVHLSLQSGDDLILKRMKRRHTRAQAIAFCDRLRNLRPDIVFGADVIAGFPTETDEMFQTTRATLARCGITYFHVFAFSARPGTPAARMPQVDGATIRARTALLRHDGTLAREAFLKSCVGTETEVLMENRGIGRTPQFAEVRIPDPPQRGTFLRVNIFSYDGERLIARADGRTDGAVAASQCNPGVVVGSSGAWDRG